MISVSAEVTWFCRVCKSSPDVFAEVTVCCRLFSTELTLVTALLAVACQLVAAAHGVVSCSEFC